MSKRKKVSTLNELTLLGATSASRHTGVIGTGFTLLLKQLENWVKYLKQWFSDSRQCRSTICGRRKAYELSMMSAQLTNHQGRVSRLKIREGTMGSVETPEKCYPHPSPQNL